MSRVTVGFLSWRTGRREGVSRDWRSKLCEGEDGEINL